MKTTEVHKDLVGLTYNEIVTNLNILSDDGDCCGYARYDQTNIPDGVDTDDLTLKACVKIEYDDVDEDRKVLNFIFKTSNDSEVLLGYDLQAGSGSGWEYGAWIKITLKDKELISCDW